jgi:hypothetical protein
MLSPLFSNRGKTQTPRKRSCGTAASGEPGKAAPAGKLLSRTVIYSLFVGNRHADACRLAESVQGLMENHDFSINYARLVPQDEMWQARHIDAEITARPRHRAQTLPA